MLRLHVERSSLYGGLWEWAGGRWVNGRSWIEPFSHPSLEAVAFTGGASWMFTVRERRPGFVPPPPAPQAGTPAPEEWPGDFTTVTVDPVAGRVRISAGVFGSAPVFACERAGVLRASWDLTELPLSGSALNEREVARLLTLRLRYSAETVFSGVFRVTERACVETTFTGALRVRYPDDALHSSPRPLADGADVVEAYESLVGTVIAGHVYDPAATLVELSGGVDSASTALSLASGPGGSMVRTGAVILDGERGAQQARRRKVLIRACGFRGRDFTVRGPGLPPLHPDGERARTGRVSPYDEPYHEAMSALHAAASRAGVRHVFTGVGGDEMVAVSRADEPGALPVGSDREFMPWIAARTRGAAEGSEEGIAPASRINEMTLFAAGCAAPVVLGCGCWPVHPLADPRLVTFGEWLPVEWRRGKRLHRERILRRGLGPEIARAPVPEVFSGIMDAGLRDHGARMGRALAREGGHLTCSGLVDAARLAEACDRLADGTAVPRDREVFDVIALEVAIGALSGDRAPVG